MQISTLFLCFFLCLQSYHEVNTAAINAPLTLISLDDLSTPERSYLESFSSQFRTRRSGDFIEPFKTKIAHGIQTKANFLSKGLSYPSARYGDSYHDHYHQHYEVPQKHGKLFDIWAVKKKILGTLFQAAKALKGGVLAVKGKIIQGGGAIISTKGKILSHGGEAITKLGKSLIHSAWFKPSEEGEFDHRFVYGLIIGHEEGCYVSNLLIFYANCACLLISTTWKRI